MDIAFYLADIKFNLKNKPAIKNWLKQTCSVEKKQLNNLSFVFCSDEYLLNINKQFLKHNYYTDIITFDYSKHDSISGEIYISIDRVKENSTTYKTNFSDELKRVMAHGVLHLLGYKDKTEAQEKQMRNLENKYIKQLSKTIT